MQISADCDERLLAIYENADAQDTERDLNFRAEFANDLDDFNAWFNNFEFADFHDIDGVKVLSLFVSDRRGKVVNVILGDEQNPEGIVKSRGILFIRAQEIEGVKAGQSLHLDGRLYLIVDCRLIQNQVWRIELEANES